MAITGRIKIIGHLGYPNESFKAPVIHNPYFERHNIDAVIVPMGCTAEDYAAFLKLVFKLSNIRGLGQRPLTARRASQRLRSVKHMPMARQNRPVRSRRTWRRLPRRDRT
jgi:hypothetical protein